MTHDDPANRFGELPERTRAFLSRLDDHEVETLESFVLTLAAFGRVGRLGRWLVIVLFTLIIGAVALWEALDKMKVWMFGR